MSQKFLRHCLEKILLLPISSTIHETSKKFSCFGKSTLDLLTNNTLLIPFLLNKTYKIVVFEKCQIQPFATSPLF